MKPDLLSNVRSLYFIGIGGIGMSALARYFKYKGVEVSGYDADRTGLGKVLEQEGIQVHYEEEQSILTSPPDLVVYTPAIPASHAGLAHYRKIGVPVLKRSELLGAISRDYRCIAVAGTHGKTTTSAMITYALRSCDEEITAFLGGWVPDLKGNYVTGDSEWLVVEADEYDRSFLTLTPEIAVVTAMDADHLDIYGSHQAMIESYLSFLTNVQEGGKVLIHVKASKYLSEAITEHLKSRQVRVLTYGEEEADIRISDFRRDGQGTQFQMSINQNEPLTATIQMPGLHNVMNATAAIAVCGVVGIDVARAAKALGAFTGIRRRFEIVYADDRLIVIDDYAHHPEELAAAIKAARLQYPEKKITGVFQPHLYSRTRDFQTEFAAALEDLDNCVLVELYPAREQPIEGVSSKLIFDKMTLQHKYLTSKQELLNVLVSIQPEVLLLLGAGDLDRMIPEMLEKLKTS
jgi:UDP-N-acetylmuramate--alanine ligase